MVGVRKIQDGEADERRFAGGGELSVENVYACRNRIDGKGEDSTRCAEWDGRDPRNGKCAYFPLCDLVKICQSFEVHEIDRKLYAGGLRMWHK